MIINTKYNIGDVLNCTVDGGSAKGKVTHIATALGIDDGVQRINYELFAKWIYTDTQKKQTVYERDVYATEAELEVLNPTNKPLRDIKEGRNEEGN